MESESDFMKQISAQGTVEEFQLRDAFLELTRRHLSAQFEILREDAWDLSQDENVITKEALRRQQINGWEDVRPALSTTVRYVRLPPSPPC